MFETRRTGTRLLTALGLSLLWAFAVGLTVTWGLTSVTQTDLYVPFFLVWSGGTIFVPLAFGAWIERMGLGVYALIAATLSVVALYYAIGRPIELILLNDRASYRVFPRIWDSAWELWIPIAVGIPLAAIYGLIYWGIRYIRGTSRGALVTIGTGAALYLITGVLFWLQSATAWFFVRIVAGVEPGQWVRFVDEVGPSSILSQTLLWPWIVLVCCG